MKHMRWVRVSIIILMGLIFLSSCAARERASESETDKETSTAAVQQDYERFLEHFLFEDQQSVQMENLEWGMSLDNALEALGLREGSYSIIRQNENDLNDHISQIVVSRQIVFDQISVEAICVYAFLDDAFYIGEYSMKFERVEDMVTVCASLQDQVEQLDLNNRLLRIPSSYDSSLDLLDEDRVRACYEGKAFGELYWVEGASSRNELHIVIPNSDDPGFNNALIVRVESGQIPHV